MTRDVTQERRDRKLRVESGASTLLRGWLTGESLPPPRPADQRRRSYRKTTRRRKPRVPV